MTAHDLTNTNEVCACLLETGSRQVRIVERCERCGSFMASDAYEDSLARVQQLETALRDYDGVLKTASLELGPGNRQRLYRQSREHDLGRLVDDFVEAARATRKKHRAALGEET